jgi:hypothetical protein
VSSERKLAIEKARASLRIARVVGCDLVSLWRNVVLLAVHLFL